MDPITSYHQRGVKKKCLQAFQPLNIIAQNGCSQNSKPKFHGCKSILTPHQDCTYLGGLEE
jgi:hypothetical protein